MALPVLNIAGIGAAMAEVAQAFLAWLISGLSKLVKNRLGTWLGAAMGWFGLQWSSDTFLFQPILDQMTAIANSQVGDALQWLGYLKFDQALTMVMSAIAIRFGLTSGKAFLRRL